MPPPDCRAGTSCHGAHGQVRLVLEVLESGKVGDIKVECGSSKLTSAAAEAAQQAQFDPGMALGKPQIMDFVLNLKF